LGRVIEYAGQKGPARWEQPVGSDWSYALFQATDAALPPKPDGTIPLVFTRKFASADALDVWRINERSFPDMPTLKVEAGKRYRFRFMNASRETHPVHFHRHSFELVSYAGVPMRGPLKDTVVLPRYGSVEADWVANNPGPSLFHCHQQIHQDAGFMQLIDYV